MVASLRQFLVVLLLLLQVAAPLVHAHVGNDGGRDGLHLHEFEKVPSLADTATLVSTAQQISAQAGIVGLGKAIERRQSLDDSAPVFYLPSQPLVFSLGCDAGIVNFSPHVSRWICEPVHNPHLSRAPPL